MAGRPLLLAALSPAPGTRSPAQYHRPTVSIELARQQWQDGARRVKEAARDPLRHGRLMTVVDALVVELRRRVGGIYTLQELADEYERVDRWALSVVAENAAVPGWESALTTAQDAAFHTYARGAQDYSP